MAKHSGPPPGYVEVSERIQEFRDKHPDGSLQAEIVELRDDLVIVKAYAYRTPDDPMPGTGLASEPIPGKTNFTRDSELMNAETSAWGRALIAVGAADAKRGIASANEVRNRQQTEAPSLKDELAALDQVIAEAKAAGIEGDYNATRAWAGESAENARTAAGRLRKAIAEKEAA